MRAVVPPDPRVKADAYLLKEAVKLIYRIERIFVPANSIVQTDIGSKIMILSRRLKEGGYFEDIPELIHLANFHITRNQKRDSKAQGMFL